jgi:hypothetical protein
VLARVLCIKKKKKKKKLKNFILFFKKKERKNQIIKLKKKIIKKLKTNEKVKNRGGGRTTLKGYRGGLATFRSAKGVATLFCPQPPLFIIIIF